ncbi:MAG: hypothetical protein HUJ63_11885 [Enterococcus sp.]|nr:hypothetical protein [Enterococcus sp.]
MFHIVDKRGDWRTTKDWLIKMEMYEPSISLDKIGLIGMEALAKATPIDSGLASESWNYFVLDNGVEWHNYDLEGGCNVIVLIECGHGLSGGGYVPPRPFVDETLSEALGDVIESLWKEVNGNEYGF